MSSKFKYELGEFARELRDISSVSEKLVSREMYNKIVEISSGLIRLSQKEFYINGGRSWNEFLELGNQLIEQCKELKQKLEQFL